MWIAVTVAFWMTLLAGARADAHWPRAPLPPDVRRALDQHYPGWRFTTIAASLQTQLAEDASAEWTAGDYDGDRQPDYAVQIVRAGSLDTPHAREHSPAAARVSADLAERAGADGC
jgi:hypothetical protein